MRKRLLRVISVYIGSILVVMLYLYNQELKVKETINLGEQIVAVNEIQQLINQELSPTGHQSDSPTYENSNTSANKINEKLESLKQSLKEIRPEEKENKQKHIAWIIGASAVLLLLAIYVYLSRAVLGPFDRMKQYVARIAQGDFELPLQMEKSNYFGAFTWAFDSMRCEIIRARASEKEQIENNKTVIATLSHDIKTPIASLRAYAEGLEAGLEDSYEKRARYAAIIMKKCDEVSKLTDDLFLHSLSDLNKLTVETEEMNLSELLLQTIEDLNGVQKDLHTNIEANIMAKVDAKRIVQIVENLVNNARKYAKSQIDITLTRTSEGSQITVRDYGTGIPNEDMPFITQKFYRGHNCGKQNGSGLGLYIVQYLVIQMNGKLMLHNQKDGLECTILLP